MNESVWAAILDKEKARERGQELEDEETDEEELEGEMEEEREFVSDVSESEDELSDLEHVTVSDPAFLHTFFFLVNAFLQLMVSSGWSGR